MNNPHIIEDLIHLKAEIRSRATPTVFLYSDGTIEHVYTPEVQEALNRIDALVESYLHAKKW